jgi:DNA-directed RNA polymerase subunit K/omega
MSLEPLSIRDIEEKTDDIYEAVVILSKRTRQIIQNRMIKRAMEERGGEDLGVFDMPEEKNPEDYVEMEKPSTIAVGDFMEGKINWRYASEEEDN